MQRSSTNKMVEHRFNADRVWRLRVTRRMFFTSRSDGDSACTDFCLISTP